MTRLFVVLAGTLAACASSSSPTSPSVEAAPETADPAPTAETAGWTPADGDRAVADLMQQCFGESSWAAEFRAEHGRKPVLRVGEVQAEASDAAALAAALGGQVEKALLDSDTIELAASVQDMAELQELQSVTALSGGPPVQSAGANLASDHVLACQVTSLAEPADGGTMHALAVSFRVVHVETGTIACVAMSKSKKLVAQAEG